MNIYKNLCRVFIVFTLCSITYNLNAQNGQNILTNGGFESNPPANNGNNIGHSVAPWTLGSGNSSNVVRVDGPGGYDYSNAGPRSDASGITNGYRHYLDITDGSNNFYQSFTPNCSGSVTVGGYFSTRANSQGSGRIEIRQGNGLTGTVVGQSVPVTIPGGNSEKDAWTPVSTQVNVVANTTYSFIVAMDNNMNFDEGYAEYDIDCGGTGTTPSEEDLCCPPLNYDEFLSMFSIDGNFQNHKVSFTPTLKWRKKMQAYTNWRHAMDPCLKSLSFNVTIRKPKAGTTDQFDYAQNTVEGGIWIAFKANDPNYTCYTGNGSTSNNGTHVFNVTLPSNRRHKIHSAVWFNPDSCAGWKDGLCDAVGFEYNLVVAKNEGNKKLKGSLKSQASVKKSR